MKYRFPLVLTLFVVVSLLMTKKGSGQEFKGGIVGGATTSQIVGDAISGFNKWGFYGGPTVSYPLKDKLDLTVQILYVQKGSKATGDEQRSSKIQPLWDKLTLNYFELPLMVEYKIKPKLTLQGGFSPDFLLNMKPVPAGDKPTELREVSANGIVGIRYKLSDRFSATGKVNYSLLPIDKGRITVRSGRHSRASDISNRPANFVIKFGLRYSLGAL
jgi:hypothetical protein